MKSSKQILIFTLQSAINLFAAFILILLIKWVLMMLGAWVSGFPGYIKWDNLNPVALSKTWNLKQVLAIYLFPYMGLVIIYVIVSLKRRVPLKIPNQLQLFYSWLYTLLLVAVFLVPIGELFNKNGIYYALSWLYFYRLEKTAFVFLLMVLFAIRVFRISPVFSSSLLVQPYSFIRRRAVIKQLPFLWYIPYLLLFISVIVVSPGIPLFNDWLLSGLLITLLLNTPLIIKYKVIIK